LFFLLVLIFYLGRQNILAQGDFLFNGKSLNRTTRLSGGFLYKEKSDL